MCRPEVMGDGQLLVIAREVAETVRGNTTIDWQHREQARAKLRSLVKRVLRRHGYPPDKQESATLLVIEQAEFFGTEEPAPKRRAQSVSLRRLQGQTFTCADAGEHPSSSRRPPGLVKD